MAHELVMVFDHRHPQWRQRVDVADRPQSHHDVHNLNVDVVATPPRCATSPPSPRSLGIRGRLVWGRRVRGCRRRHVLGRRVRSVRCGVRVAELALLAIVRTPDSSVTTAWEEALAPRELLKFDFFFAARAEFADELWDELAIMADTGGDRPAEISPAEAQAWLASSEESVSGEMFRTALKMADHRDW